ncbi:MAG TPA: hypothetical protein VLA23_11995, partial [Candidatus Limnocylindrales bacterium]|nr:hypothetical protein [Candidatus Limnocylindrales bacterium]
IDLREILTPEEVAVIAGAPLADLGWVGARAVGAEAAGARLVGVPLAVTASSLLWHPAEAFAAVGYEPPGTWAELQALTERMLADGRTPWCLGLGGGEVDGASAVDLWEDLVIEEWASSGTGLPEVARRFDGEAVTSAFERFQAMVTQDGAVKGGAHSALATRAEWSAAQMGTGRTPRCWLVHDSAAGRLDWAPPIRPDLEPLLLPLDVGAPTIRARAYTVVVLRDRPEVRALVRSMLDPEFGGRLASDPRDAGVTPALARADPGAADSTARSLQLALADAMFDDARLWIDLSDQMPRSTGMQELPSSMLRIAEAAPGTAGPEIAEVLRRLEAIGPPWTP